MLPRVGGVDRDLRVQAVGRGDRDHLDVRIAQEIAVIGVGVRDAVPLGKVSRVALGRRCHGDQLGSIRYGFHCPSDAVRLEAGADDPDLYC